MKSTKVKTHGAKRARCSVDVSYVLWAGFIEPPNRLAASVGSERLEQRWTAHSYIPPLRAERAKPNLVDVGHADIGFRHTGFACARHVEDRGSAPLIDGLGHPTRSATVPVSLSRLQSFQQNRHFSSLAPVPLKLFISCLVACSANRQTMTKYNPRCACALKVKHLCNRTNTLNH